MDIVKFNLVVRHWKSIRTLANRSIEMQRFSLCRIRAIHGIFRFVKPCCCHLVTKRTNMHVPQYAKTMYRIE